MSLYGSVKISSRSHLISVHVLLFFSCLFSSLSSQGAHFPKQYLCPIKRRCRQIASSCVLMEASMLNGYPLRGADLRERFLVENILNRI